MYQRRRARVLLAVLVFLSLVLITVDFRTTGVGPLDRLRGVATSALGPVQDGIVTIVRPIGDIGSGIGEIFRVRADNERLREQLQRAQQRRESLTDLRAENERLQALLDMRDSMDAETVAARVVALAPSNYEWVITIDQGTDAGVALGMPVVNGQGLVGRIIQVTPGASRVLLAIDPNFSAASRVARTRELGPIEGRAGGLMNFEPLDPEADIELGDEIVTALLDNGVFPPGIPIGTVERVNEETTLLSRTVEVRPFVDFQTLEHVLVVRHDPTTMPPELDGSPQAELDPPRLMPDPTPEPTPKPEAVAVEADAT